MLSSSLYICFRNLWSNHPQRVRFGPHLLTSLCLSVDDPKGCVLSRLLCSLYTSVCILHFSCIMIEFCRRPGDGPDEPTWKDTRRYEVVSLTLLFNMDYIFKRKSGEEADSKTQLTETRCFNFDRCSQFWHTDKPHRQTDSILTAFENSHAVLTLTHFTFDFSLHCGEIGGEPANSQSQKKNPSLIWCLLEPARVLQHTMFNHGCRGSLDRTELTQAVFQYYYHRNSN